MHLYGQYCPVARASEILADRWTPLIVRELLAGICRFQHPKFDVDLRVAADIRAFYRVWLGRSELREAVREDLVRLDGSPAAVRGFPAWFAWSPMADAVRAARPHAHRGTPRRAASRAILPA